MIKTMEEFRKYYLTRNLDCLTPEERLKGLPPEERLKGLSREEIEEFLKRPKNGSSPNSP